MSYFGEEESAKRVAARYGIKYPPETYAEGLERIRREADMSILGRKKLPEVKKDGSVSSCGDCYHWEPTTEDILAEEGFCYKDHLKPKACNRYFYCFDWRDFDEK